MAPIQHVTENKGAEEGFPFVEKVDFFSCLKGFYSRRNNFTFELSEK
jgi:hypothetical protein